MSDHFTKKELCHSEYAERHGIQNVPDSESMENLERLASQVLERIRQEVRRPIYITSGYRSKTVNDAVGGSPNSQHMWGEAADTVCPGVPLEQYYRKILKMVAMGDLLVDQVIYEFDSWVHISYRMENNRNMFLRASKINGQTIYKRDGYIKDRPDV